MKPSIRPILFSAPMVLALLEGRKTMTRRIARIRDIDGNDCAYGKPGDLLWVRESLRRNKEPDERDDENRGIYYIRYAADNVPNGYWSPLMILGGFNTVPRGFSVPSIHMPRAWSRLTLHITDVRVQRLQEIGQGDACAEGCPSIHEPYTWFQSLWDEINGAGAWDENPWVWALTFTVIKANVDQVLYE